MSKKPKVAVVGSLNVDHTYRVPRIPAPGETIHSHGTERSFGGKGANQAVAASRAGAEVEMIGCVGSDDLGRSYLESLEREGIGVAGVQCAPDTPTGSAVIFVDDEGENSIVVEAGANAKVIPNLVDDHEAFITEADVLLLQFEVPAEAVRRAAAVARAGNTAVVLNPSPWDSDLVRSGIAIDHLIVNASEAASLLGCKVETLDEVRREEFESLDVESLVITRGGDSTIVFCRSLGRLELQPPRVDPVDTVGAGDSFAGAFAVAVAKGLAVDRAVRFAGVAGALATLRPGAQGAIPTREKIEAKLGSL